MTTAQDIIAGALGASGIGAAGQTLSVVDTATGLKMIQRTLAEWQRRRWLVWHLVDIPLQSTGAQSYTVGPTGNFAIARPDRIESAYVRLNAGTVGALDFPLFLMESYEQYSDIWLKQLASFPASVFYDPAWPTGNVYFWPIPNTQFELHLVLKEQLQQFVNLTDTFNMPPEYEEALMWTVAAKLRPYYGKQPDPTITGAMNLAIAAIRQANFQVPALQMPPGLPMGGLGNSGAWYWSAGGGAGNNFVLDSDTLG